MSIGRSFTPYIVFAEDPLLTALAKITANKPKTISTMLNTRGFTRERILFT